MDSDYELLKKYYLEQARTGRGPGTIYYRGSRMQRGSGLGNILSNIFKSPLVKKGLSYAAKTGLSTAGDVVENLIEGKNFKQATKAGFSKQREIQKTKAVNKLKRMLAPNTRSRKKTSKTRRRGRKRVDNFGKLRR